MAQSGVTMSNDELQRILGKLTDEIGRDERKAWIEETQNVSDGIWRALVSKMNELDSRATIVDDKFLDYCNCVKSLLAVCNFGNLKNAVTDSEKAVIKNGIKKIIKHVRVCGYDVTPYLSKDDCYQIFGNDATRVDVPITFSAATVLTTLVYFRRACKRKGLYSEKELSDVFDSVTETVAEILHMFAEVMRANRHAGWGFTLSSRSKAVTLNDTYSAVDAISRFDDAFNQNDKLKRDQGFMDAVNAKAMERFGDENLTTECVNGIFRVAYNTYMRDRNADRVYGSSIFFAEAVKQNDAVKYVYKPISIEQIASSNRASALFNPLYVAMITMYGYNEKELVIRRFMNDCKLANRIYNAYELRSADDDDEQEEQVQRISEYAQTDEIKAWYDFTNFSSDVAWILSEHGRVADDDPMWQRRYDIARVFQRFVETQLPDELMKISEYREYLNSTKDAIDQVQIAYRKLDDMQRLGIVDTDYLMFSDLDYNSDSVVISKLNKASISVNYLRPMLLSSKIMIVNALVKYPQSDMQSLYNAIKDTKHRKIVTRRSAVKDDDRYEWLWNEDKVDMNATARHCEAIMYDYFDYYEKYELSYKALNNLKKYFRGSIDDDSVNEDGSLRTQKLLSSAKGLDDFKSIVFNLTDKNVEKVRVVYNTDLQEKDKEIDRLNGEIEKLKRSHEQAMERERQRHRQELAQRQTSYDIGNVVRGWIRDEADRHLKELLTYMVVNNMNGAQFAEDFSVANMMRGRKRNELVDGQFDSARELSQRIMDTYARNVKEAEEKFGSKFKDACELQILFEGALDDVLKSDTVWGIVNDETKSLDVRNESVHDAYGEIKLKKASIDYLSQHKGSKDTDKQDE